MVGVFGPDTSVHAYTAIVPSGSDAFAVMLVEAEGNTTTRSEPALTTGNWFELPTVIVTSSLAVAPRLSVTVILMTYVPATILVMARFEVVLPESVAVGPLTFSQR